jgi:hypothetical protein
MQRERERASEREREIKFIRNYCIAGFQARRVPGERDSARFPGNHSSVTRTGRRFGI